MTTNLTVAQLDRCAGVLVATACGDALGAGYEFGPPLADSTPVTMLGGGAFAWKPGEWTDDTSMALVIADALEDAAHRGISPTATEVLDRIALGWYEWHLGASDVGNQTRAVLGDAGRRAAARGAATAPEGGAEAVGAGTTCVTSHDLRLASAALHERTAHTGGNGSLMRTAPIALAFLDDGAEADLACAATTVGALTHADPQAGEACVLWCLAIRHAVRTGEIDPRRGLALFPSDRRALWSERLAIAEQSTPADFPHNGWVVEALQGAWSAIATTAVPTESPSQGSFGSAHLRLALEAAVRGGRDTDTVAAIAGGLLGAAYGVSAVPGDWRRLLHGWPGRRSADLVRQALAIATWRESAPSFPGRT